METGLPREEQVAAVVAALHEHPDLEKSMLRACALLDAALIIPELELDDAKARRQVAYLETLALAEMRRWAWPAPVTAERMLELSKARRQPL